MADPLSKPFALGTVQINRAKTYQKATIEYRHGEINPGMLGVTVLLPDGRSRLYPWRVVDWVEFEGAAAG